MVSFDNARCRCSVHPTSSELRESRRAVELILSEATRPRRVSRKRVGEDEREDFDLLLTVLVEYRRVRRPLWDMDVTKNRRSRGPITVANVPPISQNIPMAGLYLSLPSPGLTLAWISPSQGVTLLCNLLVTDNIGWKTIFCTYPKMRYMIYRT